MSYIYKITNDINEKVYIGKTDFSIEKRFNEHCQDCFKRDFENRPLYRAMKKYGINHFSIKEIEKCEQENASIREIYWINYYNSYHNGYNATYGGDGKSLIDAQELLNLWNNGLSVVSISSIVNHDRGQVALILKNNGVSQEDIIKRGSQKCGTKVIALNKNDLSEVKAFESTRDAARWLIKTQSLNEKNEGGYSTHIIEACEGKRKTCQGYK